MIYEDVQKQNILTLKSRDEVSHEIMNFLYGKLKKASIDNNFQGKELPDELAINIIRKTLKDLEEERKSIVEAKRDTKDIDFQMDLISKYLPSMLNKDEIKDIISKLEDKSVPNVMKYFKANYNGRVDMKEVSQILKEFN